MDQLLALDIAGLRVPDAGPVFLVALAVHVLAGGVGVVTGALAATATKRQGRHTRAGTVYLAAMCVVFATASLLAGLRWHHDWQLFVIACVAFGSAAFGWWARRRGGGRWMVWHGSAMAASYVALFTGFYVDNGAQLPLWNRLPHLMYWLLPAAVGLPLTIRALIRNHAWHAA
jgi:hypothetical protein